SFEPTPERSRRLADMLAKRGRERTRLRKPDRETNLSDRRVARQQVLRALDAPARHVAQRRHADALLEGAGKVEQAQLHDLGKPRQQNTLGNTLFDVLGDARALPCREPAAQVGLCARRALVEAQELVREQDAERLGILLLSR